MNTCPKCGAAAEKPTRSAHLVYACGSFEVIQAHRCRIAQLERELAEANSRIRELTEWRPMESAPSNERILVLDMFNNVTLAQWNERFRAWKDVEEFYHANHNLKGWLPLPKGTP